MQRETKRLLVGVGSWLGCLLVWASGSTAQIVYLPRAYGATALSAEINAEANYIAAQGSFLVSASVARINNAVAAEHEMHNSILWVQTFFERRRLNREARAIEEPSYMERQRIRQQKYESLVREAFQTSLGDDPTDKLNWILQELNGMSSLYQFVEEGSNSIVDTSVDARLPPQDVHHIRFMEAGAISNGERLVFRADSAEVLETHWPLVLRGSEFEDVRKRFEATRDEVIQEIKAKKEIGIAQQQKLMDRVDALCAKLSAEYPPARRTESSLTYMRYAAGKQFLQSLALAVFRAIETNDLRSFDGSYRFQGDSVADLIHHMYKYSLQFAKPEKGDEGTYRKLFYDLRTVLKQMAESPIYGEKPKSDTSK